MEFAKKEAADDALSLDGSSFMSRVLRVLIQDSINLSYAMISLSFCCKHVVM